MSRGGGGGRRSKKRVGEKKDVGSERNKIEEERKIQSVKNCCRSMAVKIKKTDKVRDRRKDKVTWKI